MAKIYLSKKERALASFRRWYKSQKALKGVTDEQVATALGITQQAVSRKMQIKGNEQSQISLSDAFIIFDLFGSTAEEIANVMKMEGSK